MPYAARTRVPISRTKTDTEELRAKHGAMGCAYALSWQTSVQSLPSIRAIEPRILSCVRTLPIEDCPSLVEYRLDPI